MDRKLQKILSESNFSKGSGLAIICDGASWGYLFNRAQEILKLADNDFSDDGVIKFDKDLRDAISLLAKARQILREGYPGVFSGAQQA